jgi:hypothetical protein
MTNVPSSIPDMSVHPDELPGIVTRYGCSFGANPLDLSRRFAHVDVAVERHDVPCAELVAVVAFVESPAESPK